MFLISTEFVDGVFFLRYDTKEDDWLYYFRSTYYVIFNTERLGNFMKNTNISKILKEYRKRSQLSVKQVSTLLRDKSVNVAEKTIYGWENGQSQPDADTLLILCDIYKIENILGTFGYRSDKVFHVSRNEMVLIEHFRSHPEMHDAIYKLLDINPGDLLIHDQKV